MENLNINERQKEQSIKEINNKLQELITSIEINKLKSVEEVDKKIVELSLFQKENQDILGIPGKYHGEQADNVLKKEGYWKLSNTLSLLDLRKNVLSGNLERFSSYATGGSIGAGHLGFMLKDYENGTFSDVIFGASAGSLFPAMFLLWKQACEVNPEKAGVGMDGLMKFLPKKLDGKDMFFNGEELIKGFKLSSQELIEIINEKLPDDKKLPNIENITIGDLSPNFRIVASRKTENGEFQEVLFGQRDNLLNSITASSNPEIEVGGVFKVSVLTNTKNKFLNNEWYDGFHTNQNPLKYGDILGVKNSNEHVSFLNQNKSKGLLVKEYTRIIPKLSDFLFGKTASTYKVEDQSGNWGQDEMKLKLIMSYYRRLSCSNFGYFLKDISEMIISKEIKKEIHDILLNSITFYDIGDIEGIEKNIELLNSLNFFTKEEKKQIIINIFYWEFADEKIKEMLKSAKTDEEKSNILEHYSGYELTSRFKITKYTPYKISLYGKDISNEKEKDGFNPKSIHDILSYINSMGFLNPTENYIKIIERYMPIEDLKEIILDKVLYNFNTNENNADYFDTFFNLESYLKIFNLPQEDIKTIIINYYKLTDKYKLKSNSLTILDLIDIFQSKEREKLLYMMLEKSNKDINNDINNELDNLFGTFRNFKLRFYPNFYRQLFTFPEGAYYYGDNSLKPKPRFCIKKGLKEYRIEFNEDMTYELYDITGFEYGEIKNTPLVQKGEVIIDEKNRKYDLRRIFE